MREGRILKPYYFCNGTNKQTQVYREDGEQCKAVTLNAYEIEELVWNDLENFLRNPQEVIVQLRDILESNLIDTVSLQRTLATLSNQLAEKQTERGNAYRGHRKGLMDDTILGEQLKEIEAEEVPLKAEVERIQGELNKAQNSNDSLFSAEGILLKLQSNLDSQLPWEAKREIVEALVDSIEVTTEQEDGKKRPRVRVRYRFDMGRFVPKPASVTTGTDVPADNCWGLKRVHYL